MDCIVAENTAFGIPKDDAANGPILPRIEGIAANHDSLTILREQVSRHGREETVSGDSNIFGEVDIDTYRGVTENIVTDSYCIYWVLRPSFNSYIRSTRGYYRLPTLVGGVLDGTTGNGDFSYGCSCFAGR